jgi:ribosomal protein S12 methylthiotransferase
LFYAYPGEVTEEVMAVLAADNSILPYLDVPVQHSSDRMLSAMARRTSASCVEDMLLSVRENVPGIAIRTTLIVGFPGETDEDFEHLLDFVKRHRFDRLGAFTYSPEEGSAAYDLPNRIPQDVAEDRYKQLMIAQSAISLSANQGKIGQTLEVLVDDPRPNDANLVAARSKADGPEVDGRVYVDGSGLKAGDLVDVEITRAEAYDLYAKLI